MLTQKPYNTCNFTFEHTTHTHSHTCIANIAFRFLQSRFCLHCAYSRDGIYIIAFSAKKVHYLRQGHTRKSDGSMDRAHMPWHPPQPEQKKTQNTLRHTFIRLRVRPVKIAPRDELFAITFAFNFEKKNAPIKYIQAHILTHLAGGLRVELHTCVCTCARLILAARAQPCVCTCVLSVCCVRASRGFCAHFRALWLRRRRRRRRVR